MFKTNLLFYNHLKLRIFVFCLTNYYISSNINASNIISNVKSESNFHDLLRCLVLGSGMASIDSTVSQPLENLQQRAQAAATNPRYKKERLSFKFLTRGTLTSATLAIPITVIQVLASDFFNKKLTDTPNQKSSMAAFLAGLVSSPFVTGRDYLVTNKSVSNISPWALISSKPTPSIFRALPAVAAREAAWTFGYLRLPCVLRANRLRYDINENLATDVICTLLSGVATAVVTQPADVIRSALQNDINGDFYKNCRDAFSKIYKTKGAEGLFAGLYHRSLLITFSVVVLDRVRRVLEYLLN